MPYFAARRRDCTTRSAEAGSARAWVRSSMPRERGTRTGAAWTAAGTRVSARSRERIVEDLLPAGPGPTALQREGRLPTLGSFLRPGVAGPARRARFG